MEHTLTAASPFFPCPTPIPRLSAVEQEVMLLNARCIAAGLPPFPLSCSGVNTGFVGSSSPGYSQFYHCSEFQECYFGGFSPLFAPPALSLPPQALEMTLGLGGPGFPLHGEAAGDIEPQQSALDLPAAPLKLKVPKVEQGGSLPYIPNKSAVADINSISVDPHGGPWLPRLLPGIHRLPGLQSLEPEVLNSNPMHSATESSFRKRPRLSAELSLTPDSPVMVPRSLHLPHLPRRPAINVVNSVPKLLMPSTTAARRRRRNISDRMKLLASVMPWERKMDTATLLEKARKYLSYLQAQVRALKYMPAISHYGVAPATRAHKDGGFVCGGLERLTRQQLLQVLVNSPLVQDRLSSLGLCLFSAEQVLLTHRIVESKMQEDLSQAGLVFSG